MPPAVIAAFWALESDFGAVHGQSARRCARWCRWPMTAAAPRCFSDETIAALKIIDRGDLAPGEMIGSWAGELGQTQFLPPHYFNYAVDYDGDGRRDLLHSAADVIGSTAQLHRHRPEMAARRAVAAGGARCRPICRGIRPTSPVKHPRSQWAQWGVTYADGTAAAERRPAGLAAAADGPLRPGVPGLRRISPPTPNGTTR